MILDLTGEVHGVFIALIVAFGLIFGSFSSVLALRIPEGKSIITPPSQCPNCHRELSPWENIPLISFLILRGRCRGCQAKIAAIYPLMEIGTAALYLLAVICGGVTPVGLAFTGFAVVTLPLFIIDWKYRRLPNILTYSTIIWSLCAGIIAALIRSDFGQLREPVLSGLGCALFFLLLNLISRGGMGMGDVKLAGVIGITLGIAGWQQAIFAIALGFLIGGIASIVLLLFRRVSFGASIPFGPSMLIGAWLAIVLGADPAHQFLQLWSVS
jgi:leader peptidase (prepilin peptidase)/N-methyltransferase